MSNWKVKNEVFLKTDQKMVLFNIGENKIIKWDFVEADWKLSKVESDKNIQING